MLTPIVTHSKFENNGVILNATSPHACANDLACLFSLSVLKQGDFYSNELHSRLKVNLMVEKDLKWFIVVSNVFGSQKPGV